MDTAGSFDFLKMYWAKMVKPEYEEVSPGFKRVKCKTYTGR